MAASLIRMSTLIAATMAAARRGSLLFVGEIRGHDLDLAGQRTPCSAMAWVSAS